ncbi:MAG: glutamate synthase [Sphingomonadales bacterium 12-68-11]|nr:MAG: glutamate synthase [Sphingomonadales bacterium 12-68-11]
MRDLDIAVAGCGIAGLAAALLLHRQGHGVTLYERFDQPRPLGSGLMIQPTGLAVLAQLGLAEEVVANGAVVTRLYGLNTLGETVLDARYADLRPTGLFGLGIHRASLFGALYDAVVSAGIPLRTGSEVVGSACEAHGRRLHFAEGESSPAHDLVVDVLGVASSLAPNSEGWLPYGALWTTLPWPADGPFDHARLEQRYERARKMAGILPTGVRRGSRDLELSLFWSLRADGVTRMQEGGLLRWKHDFLELWPECAGILEQIVDPCQLTFARYAHRTLRRPIEERLIHLGDAWHSASPQLGQGANMALLDAWALARGLANASDLAAGLNAAISVRRSHVALYQRMTAFFTPLYQSDAAFPALVRDLLFAPLSRVGPGPRVQGALVGGLAGGPLGRLGLALPDYAALSATVAVPR